MKKKIAKFAVLALGLTLIIYGAVRSYDFLSLTVPVDQQWWAYAGLAATEFGLIGWLLAFLWDEGSSTQNAISLIMMVIDFLGSIALSTADMFYVSSGKGLVAQIDPNTMTYILIGLATLVAVNVGAGLAHAAADPGAARHRAQREAFALIEDQALEKIREHAEELAAELGKEIAQDWRVRTRNTYRSKLAGNGSKSLSAPIVPILPEPESLEPVDPNPTKRRRNG